MVKGIIVIYYPMSFGATDAYIAKAKKAIKKNLKNISKSEICKSFEILVVEDPDREKVKVKVLSYPCQL